MVSPSSSGQRIGSASGAPVTPTPTNGTWRVSMIKGLISTTTRLASAIFIVSTIAACGGGGGSESGSGFIPAPPPEGADLDVTLGDANGNTITEITPLKAGLFRVAVTTPDGNPLPQEVVTGEASRHPPAGSLALTNDFTQSLEEAVTRHPIS